MKITAILVLSVCLMASAKGYTQVTLSEKDVPLQTVFKEIQKQTGYDFVYSFDLIQKVGKVTVHIKNATIEEALEECLKGTNLSYLIVAKTVAIKLKQESPKESATLENPLLDISGKITDADGNALQGATVKVKGTTKGTTTNNDGVFTLKAIDENATLEISYVGFETITVPVNNKTTIVLSLKRNESKLDEMQVIAYGTKSKRFQTGNVFSVKAEDIQKQPISNPLLALQGRVPGLFITQSTGFAGSGIKVRIQGQNSITNGNDPLYVVDGVPFVAQMLPSDNTTTGSSGGPLVNQGFATFGSPLNFISPSDIESIEILKDADATAIYGSQAANGAVLITTKKGKSGEQKVEFNIQSGWGKVTRSMNLLSTRQYLNMRYEALKNDGIPLSSLDQNSNYDLTVWDTTRYTNWQKELIGQTAHYTDLQANVSGGNANNYYSIGAGYHRETTVIPGDFNDQKASLHFQITSTSSNQKFRVSLTGNYMADENKLPRSAGGLDLTKLAIQLAPNAPSLYNSDGTLNWAPNYAGKTTWDYPGNPLAQLLNESVMKTNSLVSNCVLNYQLASGLNVKSSFGYTHLESNETIIQPLSAVMPELRSTNTSQGKYGFTTQNLWIVEPQVTYQRKILNGTLDALVGTTFQQRVSSALLLQGTGYLSEGVLDDIKAAATVQTYWNFKFNYNYNALFTRINYNWQNKFIFDLTARRDGSSRFGGNNQFHNFGSAGAAWIFTEEKFAKDFLSYLSFGKIKASYGTTGSDQIGDYRFLSTYSPITSANPYQGIVTLRSNGLSNPYLQWEETKKLSVGLDLGFFKDRILINCNYNLNRSSNQLLDYTLPITTGFSSIIRNFPATVQNTGLELALTTVNIQKKDFRWSTNLNFTISRNKLISFENIESSSYAGYLIIGESISILKQLHLIGVDQNTGVYYFSSKTNPFNPKVPDDANVIINLLPKFYGGFQNSFSYKSFVLDLLFQAVRQNGSNYSFGFLPGASRLNQPTFVLDRWQKQGDVAGHQRFNSDYALSTSYYNATSSDAAFADASYIRLKNVSISYQIDQDWIRRMHIHGFKIYAHAQNLFTLTKYKGLDPETMSSTSLPPLRVITVGAQITL